jgi:hypothetical protein
MLHESPLDPKDFHNRLRLHLEMIVSHHDHTGSLQGHGLAQYEIARVSLRPV